MMICIMCVLGLRVDVLYMNYHANGDYDIEVVFYTIKNSCGMMDFQGIISK